MKGARTRAAIIEAAATAFASSGYEATTLEYIAHQLGISRGTVLFHFDSKRDLLLAILEPLFLEIEVVITDFEHYPTPLAARRRRQLLSRYCELLVKHRLATVLLVRDLTTIVQMHWPAAGPEITQRMMRLLEGPDPDRHLKLRAAATFGAILRPVAIPPFDPSELDGEAQEIIVSSALAAYSAKV